MKTVRIQRKQKSFARQSINWLRFSTLFASMFLKPYIDENKSVVQEAKLEEIRTRTQVAEMRKQKLANDLVLQDQKIEEQQMKLALLRRELEIRNIKPNGESAPFAPESDYTK